MNMLGMRDVSEAPMVTTGSMGTNSGETGTGGGSMGTSGSMTRELKAKCRSIFLHDGDKRWHKDYFFHFAGRLDQAQGRNRQSQGRAIADCHGRDYAAFCKTSRTNWSSNDGTWRSTRPSTTNKRTPRVEVGGGEADPNSVTSPVMA
jgi:hypothetical protein